MKKLIAAFLLILAPAVYADDCSSATMGTVPFAFETITVSTAVKILTVATYVPVDGPRATAAFISVAAYDSRVRFDGVAPTSTVGHLMTAGTFFTVCENTLTRLTMIRDTGAGGDSLVTVTYMRPLQ